MRCVPQVFVMALDKVEDVVVGGDGVCKYILIELTEKKKKGSIDDGKPLATKTVVRGFEWAEYHGTVRTVKLYALLNGARILTKKRFGGQ